MIVQVKPLKQQQQYVSGYYGKTLPAKKKLKLKERKKSQSRLYKVKDAILTGLYYFKLYLESCCAHGYVYLVRDGLTLLERLFWLILLSISHYVCFYIAWQSIMRFTEKNSYVGLERNYFDWNTTLPSVTICPMERLNHQKFDDYCK